ncbi:MAG TPA: catalase [Solirubrobacteraceae bacterium]|jgi:catalase|nr:catalase [Solirubrobacteraceae bacterium]
MSEQETNGNGQVYRTTNESGIPAASDEHSLTVGPTGPTVLHDAYTVQKMQHFNRERVPERVVHAKGSGAHGFFEVTEDVTQFTSAAFLSEVGKRTPVFARFSTVAGELGSADTARDPRGFAIKFYTEEGNYDLVGNNTPVFFIRDASQFSDFIHSQKRMPDSGLRSNDMQWDFWTLTPASAHQVAILMSDRGIPRTLRNMNGYSSHTYSWINVGGQRYWVKYHFKTVQGVENLTQAEGDALASSDPDFHRRDLWEAIGAGDAPEWRLEMQIMPFEEAADYRFNPFDLTKVWPHSDYPPITIGRMVLDRNPANHFAEVEQAAFSVGGLVPGIGLSPDKMLMGRVFSYHDTHLHRIGPNYEQLPINAAKSPVSSYMKDGPMTYRHAGSQPMYAPNSYGGPKADPTKELPTWLVEMGEIGRYAYELHAEDDDFGQPGALYREVMDDTDREHMASNIIGHASADVTDEVQRRVIAYWTSVDSDLGARVAAGLGKGNGTGNGVASATTSTQGAVR